MIPHVVDASMFGPLFFDDERDQLFADLTELIAGESCTVPQHWRLEVTNQIIMGLRRKRMTPGMAADALAQIDAFPLAVDGQTGQRAAQSFDLAERHGLTIYDAAYLELAKRIGAVLVSYDKDLRSAALAESIEVLPV